jgi:hypothetical protein
MTNVMNYLKVQKVDIAKVTRLIYVFFFVIEVFNSL